MYTVLMTKAAMRDLDRPLPPRTKTSLTDAIDKLSLNPYPIGVKKLKGVDNLRRIDVGEYRVLYSIHNHNKTILIEKVGDRKEVYRFLKR